jgi:hypothetical protein
MISEEELTLSMGGVDRQKTEHHNFYPALEQIWLYLEKHFVAPL